jgi:hypothetical protein
MTTIYKPVELAAAFIDIVLTNAKALSSDEQQLLVEHIASKFPKLVASAAKERPISRNFTAAAAPELPEIAPKLWKDRSPGRQTNPVQWILDNYGNKSGDRETWDAQGLDRAKLRGVDFALAQAFDTWVSRHPDDKGLVPFGSPQKPKRFRSQNPALSGAERMALYRSRRM